MRKIIRKSIRKRLLLCDPGAELRLLVGESDEVRAKIIIVNGTEKIVKMIMLSCQTGAHPL